MLYVNFKSGNNKGRMVSYDNTKHMNTIHKKNIEEYASLYKNDNSSKSYEVRVKVDYVKQFLPTFKNGKSILEIGYGTGDLLHQIYLSYPDSSIYGLEVIDEAQNLYTKRFPHDSSIRFYTADAEKKLPFKNNFFDLIIFSHVLEHIEKEDFFMKEVSRILKGGGLVVIAVPEWEGGENHLHYRQYNKQTLLALSKKYNVKLLTLKGDGFYINKFYYLLLHLFLKQKKTNHLSKNKKKSQNSISFQLIKYIYYHIFVNLFLQINKLDNFLFRHFDRKPMQWVAVYKKKQG